MNTATVIRHNDEAEPGPASERNSLSSQEFQSTKHALPPTRLSHTILHENASQERQLNIKKAAIKTRQNAMSSKLESSRRYFVDSQARKERKWKREDEMRATSMNFPHLPSSKTEISERPVSMTVLYKSPQYQQNQSDNEMAKQLRGGGSLLPYMQLRRERTEILQHKGNAFYMTRLPTLIQIDTKKYDDYINYCGNGVDKLGAPLRDGRFNELHKLLAPNGGYFEKKEDEPKKTDQTEAIPFQNSVALSLSLPPLMTGGVTSSCAADQIKKELSMRDSQKELRRRTNWKRLRSVVSTCAKFKNKDSKLYLSTGKNKRKKKAVKSPPNKDNVNIEIIVEDHENPGQRQTGGKSLQQMNRVVHSKRKTHATLKTASAV